jgi:methyl-accepting chemotaxis protein
VTTIKRTLLSNYFAVILVMASVTALLSLAYSKSLNEEHRFNSVIFLESGLAQRATDVVQAYNDYRNSGTSDHLSLYTSAVDALNADVDLISVQAFPGSPHASLEGARYAIQALEDATDSGVTAVQSSDLARAVTAYDEANRLLVYIPDTISRVVLDELETTRPLLAALATRQRYVLGIGIVLLVLVTLISIGTATALAHKISEPLEELAHIAHDVAGGKMDVVVHADLKSGRDEIAVLAGAFDVMIHNLRSMVGGLRRANETATQAQDELSKKNSVLERLNTLFISRERRIAELKQQLKAIGHPVPEGADDEVDSPLKGV